jgi:glutamine amidotransferase
MNIGIIDYKMGNIFNVKNACDHIGFKTFIVQKQNDFHSCDAIILPGVGAFRDAMVNLEELDLIDCILRYIESEKPFIGICLGMQLLFSQGKESGETNGLNLLPGVVMKFDPNEDKLLKGLPIPQLGWNKINYCNSNFNQKDTYMYFFHSYFAKMPELAFNEYVIATTTYGGTVYPSIVKKNNVIGFQFHPERSASDGIKLLKNTLLGNFWSSK